MKNGKILTYVLWTARVLLAALFLFAGVMKLGVMPAEAMQQGPVVFPLWFLRFIGVAEVAGALGLVLPGALRIKPALTSYAALGLVVIMIGAAGTTIYGGAIASALFPAIIGAVLALIAVRTRVAKVS